MLPEAVFANSRPSGGQWRHAADSRRPIYANDDGCIENNDGDYCHDESSGPA
jgi:hypothetical protein